MKIAEKMNPLFQIRRLPGGLPDWNSASRTIAKA